MSHYDALATAWEVPLSSLPENALVLLKILAFLSPDGVQEDLLKQQVLGVTSPMLQFAKDEAKLLEAEQTLLQKSLIQKSAEDGALRMHRTAQKAVIRRMTVEERHGVMSALVDVLVSNLPDTDNTDVGHQVASWDQSERIVPHVESIIKQKEDFSIFRENDQSFAVLLLCYCWYLYEKESYSISRGNLQLALRYFCDRKSLAYASAIDLQGLIDLDLGRATNALAAFQEAYRIRTGLVPLDNALLAASFVNIGLASLSWGA